MRFVLGIVALLLMGRGYGFASTVPNGFVIEINPSTFDVNEAVDVTIKAVRSDGTVVTDFEGIVFMEVFSGSSFTPLPYDDLELPGDGVGFIIFDEQDLGQKTFSKSLIIRRAGMYTVRVYDLDERASGQRDIVVGQLQQSAPSSVSIVSPVAGGIETMSSITVLAAASDLPNSPFQILLNGAAVFSGTSDAQGSINAVVSDLDDGLNTIQIRMVDIDNIVLGQSETLSFMYEPSTDEFFEGIQILPSVQAQQGDRLVFNVSTSDAVSSVELILGTGTAIPMDRESAGTFVKQVLIEQQGQVPVSLRLNAGGNMRMYQDVSMLTVQENIAIGTVMFYTEAVDRTSITMSWQVLGQADQFLVRYGTNQDNLNQEMTVDTTEIQISNIVPTNVYYFQITPLDQSGDIIGTPSEIREIDPSSLQAQVTCIVDGITLRTEEIDDRYFFVWDAVENAERYVVYRSEVMTSIISEMRKVGETTQTRFEYPFNREALSQEFAYYAVVAICANGREILLDEVQKVEVGPYDSLLLAAIISLFFYSMWSLYRRS